MVLNVTGKATKAIYKICSKLTKKAPEGTLNKKQPFADVFQKTCSQNFANFTGKHLCWSFCLRKL